MAPPHNRSAGRSNPSSNTLASRTTPTSLSTTPEFATSLSSRPANSASLGHAPGIPSAGASFDTHRNRSKLSDTSSSADMMSPSKPSNPLSSMAAATRGNHAKLHKRGGSGSSLTGSPFASNAHSQFATPFATYEDPHPDAIVASTPRSTPKIKPYLRKMSSSVAKEDQGYVDLSKSLAENERLSGLGIHDLSAISIADIPSFAKHPHARTTSVGSQISTGSSTFRHPMKQTPRPYTPPVAPSYPSSDLTADEHETLVIEDDYRLGAGFRTRRSVSISSNHPTPLSQSHTASDLAILPKLLTTHNHSTSNLSHQSQTSTPIRTRRDTKLSSELHGPPSPAGADPAARAFSLVSRRSDADLAGSAAGSREERIRAARRKFEAKEAAKDAKQAREALKRRVTEEAKVSKQQQAQQQQRARRNTDAAAAQNPSSQPKKNDAGSERRRKKSLPALPGASATAEQETEKIPARKYEAYRPTHAAALPRYGVEAGMSEKSTHDPPEPRFERTKRSGKGGPGGWAKFSSWVRTRGLGCGGS